MASMVVDPALWRGQRVLLTGHTGFKGGWLALWLSQLGAEVHGFALPPTSEYGIYCAARLEQILASEQQADIRDYSAIASCIERIQPTVVFHLAAQPLVRLSYAEPLKTWGTNVMGTAHLLQALHGQPWLKALLVVTSDKCYQNQNWHWGYREKDRLGGHDPNSASKACQELLVDSFRSSFFAGEEAAVIASARAGNVIGGGDWSQDRLIPDAIRAMVGGETLQLRSPRSIRPWQHVLDCLHGYLLLTQALLSVGGRRYAHGWNFGPVDTDTVTVNELIQYLSQQSGGQLKWHISNEKSPYETTWLKLDSTLARTELKWRPNWPINEALRYTMNWYLAQKAGEDMLALSLKQLMAFQKSSVNP